MKYVMLILIVFAACAFAQGKGGSAETEIVYSIRSTVGLPVVGKADDGANTMQIIAPGAQEATSVAKRQPDPERPLAFGINSITPNPFNPTCEIEFEVGETGEVILEIFDIAGRLVATPVEKSDMPSGIYLIAWNGGENPSGTYLACLTFGNRAVVRRMVYLK